MDLMRLGVRTETRRKGPKTDRYKGPSKDVSCFAAQNASSLPSSYLPVG